MVLFFQLTRKNLMVKNLKRYRKQLDREQGKAEAAKYPCCVDLLKLMGFGSHFVVFYVKAFIFTI